MVSQRAAVAPEIEKEGLDGGVTSKRSPLSANQSQKATILLSGMPNKASQSHVADRMSLHKKIIAVPISASIFLFLALSLSYTSSNFRAQSTCAPPPSCPPAFPVPSRSPLPNLPQSPPAVPLGMSLQMDLTSVRSDTAVMVPALPSRIVRESEM